MNDINPKITDFNKISKAKLVKPDIKPDKSLQKKDGSFNEILTKQIGTDNNKTDLNKTGLNKTPALPEINGSFKAQNLDTDIKLKPDQADFTKKLDSSLNLLEKYASWLQDPDKTLKQAWSLLEQLTDQTKTMTKEVKDDTNFTNDLKNILNQLTTIVEVEQIKFNRGDYT